MATDYITTSDINTLGLSVYNVLPVETEITTAHIFSSYALKVNETLEGHNIYVYDIISCTHAVLKHIIKRKRVWVKIDGIKKCKPVYKYIKSENKIVNISSTMKSIRNNIYCSKEEFIPCISHNTKMLIVNGNTPYFTYPKFGEEINESVLKLCVYNELEVSHKLIEHNLI